MAHFLLASDVNLGVGRWLRGRGNGVTPAADAGCERASADELVRIANRDAQIIVTHDERLFPGALERSGDSAATVLIVPQSSLDDIQRIAEAIHQFMASERASTGSRHRLGLGSGWTVLD